MGFDVSEQDFLLTGDILYSIPSEIGSPKLDYVPQFSQYKNRRFRNRCWFVNPARVLQSVVGYEFTMEDREDLANYMVENGIAKEDTGGYAMDGVDGVRRWRNEKYAQKFTKVVSFRTPVNSNEFSEAMKKKFPCVVGFRGNREYNIDYREDAVLQGTKFSPHSYGHLTVLREWNVIDDSDAGEPYSTYILRDLKSLLKNRVYFHRAYFFFLDPEDVLRQQAEANRVSYEEEKKQAREFVKKMGISNGEE